MGSRELEAHFRVDYRMLGTSYKVMRHFTDAESARAAVRELHLGQLAWFRVSRLSADGMSWAVVEEERVAPPPGHRDRCTCAVSGICPTCSEITERRVNARKGGG